MRIRIIAAVATLAFGYFASGADALVLLSLAIAGPAKACACCTNIGHRFVEIEPFDPQRRADVGEMRFAGAARFRPGEADAELPGPTLYKEWRLTGPAKGDGLFQRAVGPGRLLTLILHGRGNACTSPTDFQRWTLLMHGKGRPIVTLLGNLDR